MTIGVLVVDMAIVAAGAVAVLRYDAPPPPASGGDAKAIVVKALAGRPADHGSTARWAHSVFMVAPGMRRPLARSEGIADFEHPGFDGRMELVEGATFDFYMDDRFEYRRQAGEERWDKRARRARDLFDPVPTSVFGSRRDWGEPSFLPDAQARRRIVENSVVSITPGGTERLRGANTRRYHVRLDEGRQGSLDRVAKAQADAWGSLIEGSLEAEVWADADGRLRKLSVQVLPHEESGFQLESEWWAFGEAPEVQIPADLGDPTANGGPGVSSITVSGGPLDGVELVEGDLGVTMDILQSDGDTFPLTFDVYEVVPGRRTRHLTVSSGRPLRVGDVLPARLSLRTSTPESTSFFPFEPVGNCDQPDGSLTVAWLVVDAEGRVVRFDAGFTLTCPGRPDVTGRVRYRSLN